MVCSPVSFFSMQSGLGMMCLDVRMMQSGLRLQSVRLQKKLSVPLHQKPIFLQRRQSIMQPRFLFYSRAPIDTNFLSDLSESESIFAIPKHFDNPSAKNAIWDMSRANKTTWFARLQAPSSPLFGRSPGVGVARTTMAEGDDCWRNGLVDGRKMLLGKIF